MFPFFGNFWLFFITFYFFVKWNLRCTTLLCWRNKKQYFILFWSAKLSFFLTFKNLNASRERNVTRLQFWMPAVVNGDYMVFVFAKMTLCSIPVLQSVVWKTVEKFFLVHEQELFHQVLISFILWAFDKLRNSSLFAKVGGILILKIWFAKFAAIYMLIKLGWFS